MMTKPVRVQLCPCTSHKLTPAVVVADDFTPFYADLRCSSLETLHLFIRSPSATVFETAWMCIHAIPSSVTTVVVHFTNHAQLGWAYPGQDVANWPFLVSVLNALPRHVSIRFRECPPLSDRVAYDSLAELHDLAEGAVIGGDTSEIQLVGRQCREPVRVILNDKLQLATGGATLEI